VRNACTLSRSRPGVGRRTARPRGDEQRVVADALAVPGEHFARSGVDGGDLASQAQIDAALGVVLRRLERNPLRRCAAGEIILRQVGAIARRIFVALNIVSVPRTRGRAGGWPPRSRPRRRR
jgi:hypothetical protein